MLKTGKIMGSGSAPLAHEKIRSAFSSKNALYKPSASIRGGSKATFDRARELSSMVTGFINAIFTGIGKHINIYK